jgi:hypothetical protein
MKRISLILLLLTSVAALNAQDLIYKTRDKTPVAAKLQRIGPMMVRYKKFNNPGGPEIMIPKRSVDSIVYENGDIERFVRARPDHRPAHASRFRQREYIPMAANIVSAGFQRHKVGFNPFGSGYYYNSNLKNEPIAAFYISYERRFWKDRIGIEMTPFIGEEATKGISVAARIYPANWGKVRFGFGPEYSFITQEMTGSYAVNDAYGTLYARQQSRLSSITFSGKMLVNITPEYSFNFQFFGGKIFERKVIGCDWDWDTGSDLTSTYKYHPPFAQPLFPD